MVYVLIKDQVVEFIISVNAITDLTDIYPEHEIIERVGDETIDWTYDGVTFTAPIGG